MVENSYYTWPGAGTDNDVVNVVTPVKVGQWHHVAATYDQADIKSIMTQGLKIAVTSVSPKAKLAIILTIFSLLLSSNWAAGSTFPDEPVARLGKGKITNIAYSPDGSLLAVDKHLQHNIMAHIHRGEDHYVAECVEISVVTQGKTLDETMANLQEAIQLHLEGEDPAEYGLVANPTVLVITDAKPNIWPSLHKL